MDADFILPKEWVFKKEYSLPKTYRGYVLRGAKVVSATGEPGNIIIQTFTQPHFTIRFKFIELVQAVKIKCRQRNDSLISFLALKNNIHYKIKGLGVLQLSSGQFSLLQSRELSFVANYEKNITYQSLEIDWSEEIIREHVPYFSILENIQRQNETNKKFFVGKPVHTADDKLFGLANEILKSPYDVPLNEVSFQHKAREYFFLMMVAIGKVSPSGLHFTNEEWEKIDAIAELLKNEPGNKFPIASLATNAQMNATKLKEGFKERYNSGLFEYQMGWRMKEAMRLLEETDIHPKEISSRVGYKTLGSFITKFREYYGYPPGKVIRKYL